MVAEVWYEERVVGEIRWTPDAYGVQITLTCAIPCDPLVLLRCYGETDGKDLLIGLPEPQDGKLQLRRHLSKETLKAAGCLEEPPVEFYLSERAGRVHKEKQSKSPAVKLQTGDVILDALIDSGTVEARQEGDVLCLYCPFVPDAAFALAPAFVLCSVEKGKAVLRWTKKDAADKAASQKIT